MQVHSFLSFSPLAHALLQQSPFLFAPSLLSILSSNLPSHHPKEEKGEEKEEEEGGNLKQREKNSEKKRTFPPPVKLHGNPLVHVLLQIQNVLLLRPLPLLLLLLLRICRTRPSASSPTSSSSSSAAAAKIATATSPAVRSVCHLLLFVFFRSALLCLVCCSWWCVRALTRRGVAGGKGRGGPKQREGS